MSTEGEISGRGFTMADPGNATVALDVPSTPPGPATELKQ